MRYPLLQEYFKIFLKGPGAFSHSFQYTIVWSNTSIVLWGWKVKKTFRWSVPPPPLSIWAFVGLCVLTVVIYRIFLPKPGTEAWGLFHWLLIIGVATAGIILFAVFWPVEHRCTLHYRELYYYEPDREKIYYQEWCGAPAVGSIMVSGSLSEKKYFCAVHNPELKWMARWLAENHLQVLPATQIVFCVADDSSQP